MNPASTRPRKQKILIVDDDPDMRIFFSTLLKTGGFRPIVARSDREGMDKARKESPCVIVIDVPMPDNMGMQMFRELKQDPELRRIPVFLISSIDEQTFIHFQKTKGFRAAHDEDGPAAFLEKPPEAAEFLNLIQEIISRSAG